MKKAADARLSDVMEESTGPFQSVLVIEGCDIFMETEIFIIIF